MTFWDPVFAANENCQIMCMIPHSALPKVFQFTIPSLILLGGLLSLVGGGIAVAALSVPVAGLCFYAIQVLIKEISKAHEQKCFLDEQLIQSQKLAAIGELSAGISHEINNPLAIIAQEVEWARYQFDGKEPQEVNASEVGDSLGEIARQVERCREITHKLLDFARRKDPLIQGVDVNKLIEDMAKLVEKEASQKNIRIVRAYRKDMPTIHTDPPLLRQVILNLLNNASYAVRENGEIRIETRALDNGLTELVIKDNGCGIPKNDLGKIFDPFFTTKPPGKGTGLGLSICHGIIVRLGGQITVESEPGKGTAFTVRLPIVHESRKVSAHVLEA